MSLRTILFSLPLISSLISYTIATSAGKLQDGHLRPCPDSPNCVTSDSEGNNRLAPINFSGSSEKAWQRIQRIVEDLGGDIKTEQPLYLWATFTSAVFHFVDDVELRMVSEEKLIHIRSGARIGYWDFGVNKKRVQKIRRLFLENPANDKQPRPGALPGTG